MNGDDLVEPEFTVRKTPHVVHVVHDQKGLHVVKVAFGHVTKTLGAGRVRKVKTDPHLAFIEMDHLGLEVHADRASDRAHLARVRLDQTVQKHRFAYTGIANQHELEAKVTFVHVLIVHLAQTIMTWMV